MFGLFELFQIGHFRHAQHLDLVMVDKIQMPHKGECGAVGFYADTVVAAGRARRPRHLQLALVVLIKAAYRNTGHGLPSGFYILASLKLTSFVLTSLKLCFQVAFAFSNCGLQVGHGCPTLFQLAGVCGASIYGQGAFFLHNKLAAFGICGEAFLHGVQRCLAALR